MELEKLKSIRIGNKSVITRLFNKIDEARNETEIDTEGILTNFEKIVKKQTFLEELSEKILELTKTEDVEGEIIESEEYSVTLETKIKHVRKFILEIQPSAKSHTDESSHSNLLNPDTPPFVPSSYAPQHDSQHLPISNPLYIAQPSMSSNISRGSNDSHRLPKLTLPKFSGHILEWQTFWDSFESAVHLNTSLTNVQKFNYLKAQLENEALQSIAGFALTNLNYDEAINVLKERFGKNDKIVSTYLEALIEIPQPRNDLHSLKTFYDQIESYVRGLDALGESQETYGKLLVPIILKKLPGEMRKNLRRVHGTSTWILRDLRSSIFEEINIMDEGHDVDEYRSIPTTSSFITGMRSKPRQNQNRYVNQSLDKRPCIFCHEIHSPTYCTNVKDVSIRTTIVKREKLCFNCLGNHQLKECKSNKTCKNCKKRHHTSICNQTDARQICESNQSNNKTRPQMIKTNQQSHPNSTSVNLVNDMESSSTNILYSHSTEARASVLLKTAVAPVGFNSTYIDTNILFDEGAQRSFVTEDLASKLNLKPTGKEILNLSTFGGGEKDTRHLETATVYLITDSGHKLPIKVLIVPRIATPLQNHLYKIEHQHEYLRGLKLAHPITEQDSFDISLLVGADYYWNIVEDRIIRGKGPTAVKSKIGYLLSGPINENLDQKNPASTTSLFNILISHKIDESNIEKFWNLESIGINSKDADVTDTSEYLRLYQENSIEFRDNRYIARLPWKQDHDELPSNFMVAKRRTESVIRRLSQKPDMLEKYGKIIAEQERRDFIEKVNDTESDSPRVHYIPHHPVYKESSTTPIRIVYDCSCRQSQNFPSLNDCLMDTPPELNDLTKILLKFRADPVAITTDIEKAFLHIGLNEADRDATRFLWLSDPSDPNSSLQIYRFKSILFGATCSPFILSATLLKHLLLNNSKAAEIMERDIYVDNVISSARDEDEATQYFYKARKMMSNAGFNLRSWSSNSEKVRRIADTEGVLDKDQLTKVLGMLWNSKSDILMYPSRQIISENNDRLTKREILRYTSQIYDPLGLITPVTIRAKALIQELWKSGLDWDQPIPDYFRNTWTNIASDIQQATKIVIPRPYFQQFTSEHCTLHVFTDASPIAYGAAAYLCNGTESTLVMAKSRVAPVKNLTLPQLELMAAVIGSRLSTHIKSTLKYQSVVFWSDSCIVLHWLKSSKSLKRFVANRVNEIRESTRDAEWRYCPTQHNPADLVTRGITEAKFTESVLWRKGPEWLIDINRWPIDQTTTTEAVMSTSTDEFQTKSNIHVCCNPESKALNITNVIDIERYSSYMKLIRVTAYIQRFIFNCKQSKDERRTAKLRNTEIDFAVRTWIQHCQETSFETELSQMKNAEKKLSKSSSSSRIRQLGLFIDKNGLIRCNGRIHNAPIPELVKFPYLLPPDHEFTKLLVIDAHEHLLHSGMNATVTHLRQQFWIPTIRQCVKKILHKCVRCKKVIGKPYQAPTAPPLPKIRVQEAPPFTYTGVDYTGALIVRGENSTYKKAYICLFTCASTRAVHLEVVPNLSEHSFIQAFRRFISRKSLPRILISDNSTTFIAGSEEIKRLIKSAEITNYLSSHGVEWKFIPKRAPWYGGFWERLIALTKTSLKKTLGRSQVNMETLVTIIAEIEAILNDRPLTYPSSDIKDCEALTPAHILYGRRITTLSYPCVEICETFDPTFDEHSNINKRAKNQILLIQNFWKRWKTEYLTSLREFNRTTGNNEQKIKIGDIVQIHDESKRVNWKIGIVTDIVRGNDGLVRSAHIRTKTGETTRPIVKLYPLEVSNSEINTNACENDIDKINTDDRPMRQARVKALENIRQWTGRR